MRFEVCRHGCLQVTDCRGSLQDWGSALKVIGNANAYTAWNMSRSEKALRSREALLRAALTGEAFHSTAILR